MSIGSKAVQGVLRFGVDRRSAAEVKQQFLTMHGLGRLGFRLQGSRSPVVIDAARASGSPVLVLPIHPPPPVTTATAAIATMPATTQASTTDDYHYSAPCATNRAVTHCHCVGPAWATA